MPEEPIIDLQSDSYFMGEALRQAVSLRPDIIVIDFEMPGMNGLDATEWLKADPRTRSHRDERS